MSIVAKNVNAISESFQSLSSLTPLLEQKLSEIDKQLDQMYHGIEHGNYGTVQAHKILMELQKLRRRRRVIKHEIQRIAPVVKILKDKDLLNRLKQVTDVTNFKVEETNSWTAQWGIELEEVLNCR